MQLRNVHQVAQSAFTLSEHGTAAAIAINEVWANVHGIVVVLSITLVGSLVIVAFARVVEFVWERAL